MSSTKGKFLISLVALAGLLASSPVWAKTVYAIGGGLITLPASGGAPGNPGEPYTIAIYQKIGQLAAKNSGKQRPTIGILTTGSAASSAAINGQGIALDFQAAGVNAVYIPFNRATGAADCRRTRSGTSTEGRAIINQINSVDGFFFGGGDQSRINNCFFLYNNTVTNPNSPDGFSDSGYSTNATRTSSAVATALINKFNAGAPVGGSSAGAAIQTGIPMPTEGVTYEAIIGGAFPDFQDVLPTQFFNDLSYDQLGGFGFFPYGLVDQHFSQRGRQGRALRIATASGPGLTPPLRNAYGVDENTALIVTDVGTPQAKMEVAGQFGVSIFDLAGAYKFNSPWSIFNVKLSYLTDGDAYDPIRNIAAIKPSKVALIGTSNTVPSSIDIFSSPRGGGTGSTRPLGGEFLRVAFGLFDSLAKAASGTTWEPNAPYSPTTPPAGFSSLIDRNYPTNPRYVVGLYKSRTYRTQGYKGPDSLNKTVTSFTNLVMAVAPNPLPSFWQLVN